MLRSPSVCCISRRQNLIFLTWNLTCFQMATKLWKKKNVESFYEFFVISVLFFLIVANHRQWPTLKQRAELFENIIESMIKNLKFHTNRKDQRKKAAFTLWKGQNRSILTPPNVIRHVTLSIEWRVSILRLDFLFNGILYIKIKLLVMI